MQSERDPPHAEGAADAEDDTRREPPVRAGVRALLDELADGDPDDTLALSGVLRDLGRSTFGVLLFMSTLPAFIPIPGVAGALSGPLVMLTSVQLLFLMRRPWLPGFIARRGPQRRTVIRFERVSDRALKWLERMVRPRLTTVVVHPAAVVFTGLQLLLLGLLLSLPIPFTNYAFACLLMVYALALLELDGALMLACWVLGVGTIAFFGVLSGNLIALTWAWVQSLY